MRCAQAGDFSLSLLENQDQSRLQAISSTEGFAPTIVAENGLETDFEDVRRCPDKYLEGQGEH